MAPETTPWQDDDALVDLEPDAAVTEAAEHVEEEASAEVMHLLAEGVPLALLADLVSPDGPASPAILEDEGLPDVAWWDGGDEGHHERSEPQTAG
ncbi:hypothetical protein [Actinotalea subterranea]|uniref:hypothetical protein n=1 Tax=Actinotalea subterranea TaxID=2607497 RepID=UPI0011EF7CE4|nr:hypothetical protein [Actinotalea subterranea]